MSDLACGSLQGLRLLVVEDDYMIASDLVDWLEDVGAEVIGPAGSVADALELVQASGHQLDGALLDVNLRGERVYPVADALAARHVPFIFTTGYDSMAMPDEYAAVRRCEKPIDKTLLARLLPQWHVRSGSATPGMPAGPG